MASTNCATAPYAGVARTVSAVDLRGSDPQRSDWPPIAARAVRAVGSGLHTSTIQLSNRGGRDSNPHLRAINPGVSSPLHHRPLRWCGPYTRTAIRQSSTPYPRGSGPESWYPIHPARRHTSTIHLSNAGTLPAVTPKLSGAFPIAMPLLGQLVARAGGCCHRANQSRWCRSQGQFVQPPDARSHAGRIFSCQAHHSRL